MRGHQQNSGLNHYLTLIANLLKVAHQGLLPQVSFIWENAGSYE